MRTRSDTFVDSAKRVAVLLGAGAALATAEDLRHAQAAHAGPEPLPGPPARPALTLVPALPAAEPEPELEPAADLEPAAALEPPAAEPVPAPWRTGLRRSSKALKLAVQLGLVVAWAWWAMPQSIGGRADWVMVSGWSMEPRYHTGDLVLVDRQSHYHVGEVIAYHVPKGQVGAGAVVIHRIVGGNGATGWTVKGDNRTAPDLWHPKNSDVIGAKTLRIPDAFAVIRYVRSPLMLGLLASFFVFFKLGLGDRKRTDEEAPA